MINKINKEKIVVKKADSTQAFNFVQNMHKEIWSLDDIEVTPAHIYSAVNNNGGLTLCAYYLDKPVGYVFGFCGKDEENNIYFYSHNLGVIEEFRNYGIGFLLKLELAKELLKQNINIVKWSFDPLDSKNANLYINKLGAISDTYINDYYGDMQDGINKNLPGDRIVAEWSINDSLVEKMSIGHELRKKTNTYNLKKDRMLNSVKTDDKNITYPIDDNKSIIHEKSKKHYYLEIPTNIDVLKKISFETVLDWRSHVRDIMKYCFKNNFFISDTIYTNNKFYFVLTFKKGEK